VAGETDRQVAGVRRTWRLRRVDQKAEAGQVFGGGEAIGAERQLQRSEPVVLQAFHLGALRRVVVALAVRVAPLLEIVQGLRRLILRQVGIGDEVEPDADRKHGQRQQPEQGTSQQSHLYILVALWRVRLYRRLGG